MDLFSTDALVAQVEDLRGRPPSNPTLLSIFFPNIIEETSEEIHFDAGNKPRRIAPFVSPLMEGKLVESLGHTTKTFKPAYVKDKRVFDSARPLKRVMGEALTGNLSPQERIQRLIAMDLADQLSMLRRRKEVMASEALRLGQVTVTGDGFPTVVVNFGRDAGLSIDLSGGAAEWDDAGVSPVENVEDWSATVLEKSGGFPTDVIFTPNAWRLFRADPLFEKAVDLRRAGNDRVDFTPRIDTGLVFLGTMGNRRLFLYYDWYIDDAGAEVPIIPDNTVILGSAAIEGVQAQGAIRDEEAGFQATEFWPKSWVQKDPSVRFLLGQSAPLVVPFRADASLSAIVT